MDFIEKLASAFLFFSCVFLSGCSSETPPVPRDINYVHYSNKVVNQFCDEIEKKNGLICVGAGGSFAHDIQSIHLRFISYQTPNCEEARKIEIIAIEKFLKAINENKEVRPYLREHPFTPDRVNISISFRDKKKELEEDGALYSVFQAKNNILFYFKDSSNKFKYRTEKEPYEEALLKVQKENPGLNLRERQ